jgi:hypothetical protein
MPNGGVPIHMALYPKDGSPFVFHFKGGRLFLYERDTWEREGVNGKALCTLTQDEGGDVAWFLKYWLGDEALQPAYSIRDRVKADFEF